MTKIITKLPVAADALKSFRDSALMTMINGAVAKIEQHFEKLCAEFTTRFNANEWIFMSKKDVYYINDIVAIIPNLKNFQCKTTQERYGYTYESEPLKFYGFNGDLMTEGESQKCFNDKLYYFRNESGDIVFKNPPSYPRGITFKKGNQYWYRYVYRDNYKGTTKRHGNQTNNDDMVSVPIFRFNGEDSAKATAAAAILYWLKYDLTPQKFISNNTKNIFNSLKNIYANSKIYLKVDGEKIIFDRKKSLTPLLPVQLLIYFPTRRNFYHLRRLRRRTILLENLKPSCLSATISAQILTPTTKIF